MLGMPKSFAASPLLSTTRSMGLLAAHSRPALPSVKGLGSGLGQTRSFGTDGQLVGATYLLTTDLMFWIGLIGAVVFRRNLIVMLLATEIVMLACNMNFLFGAAYLNDMMVSRWPHAPGVLLHGACSYIWSNISSQEHGVCHWKSCSQMLRNAGCRHAMQHSDWHAIWVLGHTEALHLGKCSSCMQQSWGHILVSRQLALYRCYTRLGTSHSYVMHVLVTYQ